MLLVATEICLLATRMCCGGTAERWHQGQGVPPAPGSRALPWGCCYSLCPCPSEMGSAWSVGARSNPGAPGHSQEELPSSGLAMGTARPDGAAFVLWMGPQLPALIPSHCMAGQPVQSQQLTPVTPVSEGCVSGTGDLCALQGHCKQENRTGTYCISSFTHRFLLQWLQAGALRLTTGKTITPGELCHQVNPAVTHSPAQQAPLWVLLWGPGGEQG